MKINKLTNELNTILKSMEKNEAKIDAITASVHKEFKQSAKNLCRYLILRSYDLRQYHDNLSDLGLSAMRSSEGYVYNNLYQVVKNLNLMQGQSFKSEPGRELIGYKRSKKILRKHARTLFDASSKRNFTEIMVTLPLEAAEDKKMIRDMVANGMEIARINLSHGDLEIWTKMVKNIKKVQKEFRQKIKIYMDLSGPKIRTAKIQILSKKGKVKNGIKIRRGEHIILTKRNTKGKKSKFDDQGKQLEKAEVGVLLHEIIDDVRVDDAVLFDDGMIRAKVVRKSKGEVELLITDCYKAKLSSLKGINLPDTQLNLPALTKKDIKNLPFVCKHADIVGYSFVRTGDDVKVLYKQLKKHDAKDLGVVFKIENKEAFENLPQILLAGMQRDKIGVMIARGDLAVEIGFERISEVQKQIMWICEAAHVPVIWATQVLENLAKTGLPTRAEISDAAQGARAECVMLNKGPFINDAIRTLRNILIRMEGHSFKKKDALRALNVAKQAIPELKLY